MGRAAFLDRDGVLNFRHPEDVMRYITRVEDFEILPGAAEAVGALVGAGWKVFVVSNQRGVSRGLVTPAELEKMHARFDAAARSHGGAPDAVYYCPHDLADDCECRKPRPGLLLRALREHPDIDLAESFMVGDTESDRRAAESAGVRFFSMDSNGNLLAVLKAAGVLG